MLARKILRHDFIALKVERGIKELGTMFIPEIKIFLIVETDEIRFK